jgi:hypothetical protein
VIVYPVLEVSRMRWIALCLALLAVPAWADTGLTQSCTDATPAGSVLPDCHAYAYVIPSAETLVASRPVGGSDRWNDPALTWKPYGALTSGEEYRGCALDLAPGTAWTAAQADPCKGSDGDAHIWQAVVSQGGAVELTWEAPTENEDGSPLTDLAGFKVYWGTAPGEYSATVSVGNVTTYLVEHLSPGTYYFAATAVNAEGTESAKSDEANATIEKNPKRPRAPAILSLTLRSR